MREHNPGGDQGLGRALIRLNNDTCARARARSSGKHLATCECLTRAAQSFGQPARKRKVAAGRVKLSAKSSPARETPPLSRIMQATGAQTITWPIRANKASASQQLSGPLVARALNLARGPLARRCFQHRKSARTVNLTLPLRPFATGSRLAERLCQTRRGRNVP